jgi:hypothetical protein
VLSGCVEQLLLVPDAQGQVLSVLPQKVHLFIVEALGYLIVEAVSLVDQVLGVFLGDAKFFTGHDFSPFFRGDDDRN